MSLRSAASRAGRFEVLALLALLALAAALRSQYLRELILEPRFPRPTLQAGLNAAWARASATGEWSGPGPYRSLLADVATAPYVHPPGYPMFVAGWYRVFGTNPMWVLAFQQLLGLFTVLCLWTAGRRWIGVWGGWAAAVLAALHWTPIYYAGEFLDAAILPPLVIGTLVLWVRGTERIADLPRAEREPGHPPNWLAALASGLGLGLLLLMRPLPGLLFGGVLAAWSVAVLLRHLAAADHASASSPGDGNELLVSEANARGSAGFVRLIRQSPTAVRHCRSVLLALLVGALALVAPVTWRNWQVGGQVVVVSVNRSVMCLVGSLPRHEGLDDGDTGPGRRLDRVSTYRRLAQAAGSESPRAIRRHFRGRLHRLIRQHPEATGLSLARRVQLFWNPLEVGDARVVEYDRAASELLRRLPVSNVLVFGLALLGLAVHLWSRRVAKPSAPEGSAPRVDLRLPSLVFVALLAWTLSHLGFLASGLWRHPMLPVLLLAAGWAIEDLRESLAGRRARDLLSGCICLALVLWTASLNLGGYIPNRAAWLYDRGLALEDAGEQDAAEVAFRTALLATPGLLDPATGARGSGPVLNASDQRRFHASAALACMKLGAAAVRDVNPLLAVRYYRLAGRLDPDKSDALINAGILLLRANQPAEAAGLLRMALERDARAHPALFPLAQALYRMGEYDEAVVELDRLLAILPDHQAARSLRALVAVEGDVGRP